MKALGCSVILGVLLAWYAGQLAGQLGGQNTSAQPAASSSADEAAIKKAAASFIAAFEAGNAKALAAHWTENGEYIADDGAIYRGRAAIERGYGELFGAKVQRKASAEDVTIRFPSRDTAIEEGYFRVQPANQPAVVNRYSVLHVREGDQWLMAIVREWPSAGAALHELDWLIGSWEAKRGDTEVRTTYEWWGGKSFIRAAITLKQQDHTSTGMQMIGKDSATGQLRSWTFDSEGSFGEATWTRDGKKWLQDWSAVMTDGHIHTATHMLTRIDDNAFFFQAVQRALNGDEVDDTPPIRVTRVKTK
jgi:uncharacterized protein (TIGR02246 family)